MATHYRRGADLLERLFAEKSVQELRERLAPKPGEVSSRFPPGASVSEQAIEARWSATDVSPEARAQVLDPLTEAQVERYRRNIENFIGTVKVPVGLVGPLRVNGVSAQGDYMIPRATSEAALVASHHRGAGVITAAGGCAAALIEEGVSRSPGFAFGTLPEAGEFAAWAMGSIDEFRKVAESTTRHGKLVDMRVTVEGNHVYINFDFLTGDASGQNMVTIATDAICEFIERESPIKSRYHFVEANLSGDKKASYQSFIHVRGKRVTAEVVLPAELVKKRLRTTPKSMVEYWIMSAVGGVLSGTMGVQGHYANGLAALYIACGQDAACVAESAVGVTRFEVTDDGGLYASVTLPNLMLGTVGGGTGLPSQNACLEIMGLAGAGNAKALAEVMAGLALAGELSIIAALCSGDFTRAHRLLARKKTAATARRKDAHA